MARTPGLDVAQAQITVTTATGDACPPQASVATPCYVTVRVQYTFRTLVPWPLIPSAATFDRSTTMRRYF